MYAVVQREYQTGWNKMTLSFASGDSTPFPLPPRPKPFDMTEPFNEHGVWCFWLTADLPVLQFVTHLNCVLNVAFMPPPFAARPHGRVLVRINPRYDHQEAWLWLYEQLELETRPVDLNDTWETTLAAICSTETAGDFEDGGWDD